MEQKEQQNAEQQSVQQQPSADLARADRAWLSSLVRELFQTEQSAKEHPLVEAQRLGDVPPATILREVAAHAEVALAELPRLAERYGLPDSKAGRGVGAAFSTLRDRFVDLLVNLERSYRGTLLGMHHGVDLVDLIQHVALAQEDLELADWCARWLARRRPLVEEAARALAWFADNPARAREPAKTTPFAVGLQSLVHGLEQVAGRVRNQLAPGRAA